MLCILCLLIDACCLLHFLSTVKEAQKHVGLPPVATECSPWVQDRIGSDGALIAGTLPGKQQHAAQKQSQPRPASLPSTAPVLPPIAEAQLQQLVNFIGDSR